MISRCGRNGFRGSHRIGRSIGFLVSPRSTAVVRVFPRSFVRSFVRSFFRSFDPPLSIGSKIHPPGRRAIRFQPAGHPSVQTIVRLRNPTFAGVTARTGEDGPTDRRTDGPRGDDARARRSHPSFDRSRSRSRSLDHTRRRGFFRGYAQNLGRKKA